MTGPDQTVADRRPIALLRSAAGSAALRATVVMGLGTAVRFLTQLVLANWLGAAGYGVFVVARGWGESLAKLPTRGYLLTIMRNLPRYRSEENWPAFRGLLRVSSLETLGWSAVLAGSGVALARLFGADQGTQIGMLLVPIVAYLALAICTLQALDRYPTAMAVTDLVQPVLLALLVGGLVLADQATAGTAVAVYVLSLAVSGVLLSRVRRQVLPPAALAARPRNLRAEWVRTARPMYVAQLAITVLGVADLLIVGAVLGPVEAGIFAAATRLAFLSQIVENGAESVAAGPISEAFGRGDVVEVQRQVDRTIALAAPPTLLLGLLSVPFGGWVLGLLGEEFRRGGIVLILLLASNVVMAVNGPVGFVVSLSGLERTYAAVLAGHAVAGVGLSALAAWQGSIAWVALASTATTLSWNVWLTVIARRRLGVRCWPVARTWTMLLAARRGG